MSKLLFFSDLHLYEGTPRARIDDYQATQERKFKWLVDYANNNVDAVYCTGDITEHAQSPLHHITKWSGGLRELKVPFRAVAGNHSQYMRILKSGNTTFDVMVASGLIENSPDYKEANHVRVTMCDYGEDILPLENGYFNILCIHAGITEKPFPWAKNEPWFVAKELLERYKYDIIFSGHVHSILDVEVDGRKLYNIGSIFRSNVDQSEHQPRVLVFDTETKEITEVFIPIEPAKNVLNYEKHYEEVERKKRNSSFVDGLENATEFILDFESQLAYELKNKDVRNGTREIIKECVG